MSERKVLTKWPTRLTDGRWRYHYSGMHADGVFKLTHRGITFIGVAVDVAPPLCNVEWSRHVWDAGDRFEPIPDAPADTSTAVEDVVIPRMAEILTETAALLGVPPEGVPDAVRRLLEPAPKLEALREADEKARYVDDALDALEEWASAGYPGTKGGTL